MITDYNPYNPEICELISKYWPICDRSSSTRSLLLTQIIYAYRKPKSLDQILCKTDIMISENNTGKRVTCPNFLKCKFCPYISKDKTIVSHSTKRKYRCLSTVCCRSKNLIYCIICQECGIQYVGQTKLELRSRLSNHLSSIRYGYETPVARHYIKHQKMSLKVSVLQLIRDCPNKDTTHERLKWEDIWIARLYSLTPKV